MHPTPSQSLLWSQDTGIREIPEPSPFSFHSFLSSYCAAALIRDIVLTVLIANRMWRREVFTIVRQSECTMPHIIYENTFHETSGLVLSNLILNLDRNENCSHTDVHSQRTLPLLFCSAYPLAGSPTPSSPCQTSPAARLSLLTSPFHCAPGDSAGPWPLSACPPGASAALPSPAGMPRSRRSALVHTVQPGFLHRSTQHLL